MRVRRVYKKVAEAIEGKKLSDTEPDETTPSTPAVDKTPSNPCNRLGAVTSVFIEPSHLEILPGSKACVEISASDSNACPVKVGLDWAKGAPRPRGVRIVEGKCISVSQNAPSGKHSLHLQTAGVGVELILTINKANKSKTKTGSTPEQRVATLQAITTDKHAGDTEKPDAPTADAGVQSRREDNDNISHIKTAGSKKEPLQDLPSDSRKSIVRNEGFPSWLLPFAVGAGLLLVLIVVIVLIMRKHSSAGSKPQVSPAAAVDDAPEDLTAREQPLPPRPQRVMSPTRVEPLRPAPLEHSKENPGVDADSAPLPGPGEQQPQPPTKFCIGCGKKLPAEARFCPYCAQKQE
jgi:RNA polymerase subunit RPABC4/transcription elongation factor Spt4